MIPRRTFIACAASLALPVARAAEPGVRPRPLKFPVDFGAHPDTRTEWWYVTGELQSGDRTFGFQVTFFRSNTGITGDHPSRFTPRQIVFAHAAVSDVGGKQMRHDQRIAREGFGVVRAKEGDTDIRLRDWTMARSGSAEDSRYVMNVRSEVGGFAFELEAKATRIVLQGNGGLSTKGRKPGEASHYYSRPQLEVDGTLTLDGKPLTVKGRAWLDHEWSNLYMDSEAVGWDWLGMNLDNGQALMAFRMRRADGAAVFAGGSWADGKGKVRAFAPEEVRFTPGRTWTSAATRAVYPVEWTLETPNGKFLVKSLIDNQEIDSRASTGAIYWEGLSDLTDASGKRVGRGYLEMTGYAGRLRL